MLFINCVYSEINRYRNKKKIIAGPDYIKRSKKFLKEFIANVIFPKEKARMFFYTNDNELEAVEIKLLNIYPNWEFLEQSLDFFRGDCGDFIIVDENLTFGISMEITEYWYEFYAWGLGSP